MLKNVRKVICCTLVLIILLMSSNFAFASAECEMNSMKEILAEKHVNLIKDHVNENEIVSNIRVATDKYVAELNNANMLFPMSGDGEIITELFTGEHISMNLPEEVSDAEAVLTQNGTTVYASADNPVELLVHATETEIRPGELEYGVRAIIVIEDETAPKDYTFEYNLPKGGYLISGSELNSDEFEKDEVAIIGSDGFIISVIKSPWAKDANGNSLETYYIISGNKLIQHIEFDGSTKFPVTADPWYGTGTMTEDYGEPEMVGFTAFAAGQGTNGFRFRNGGYIVYSRGSGVTVSTSISLGAGYGAATVSADIGFAYQSDNIGAGYVVPNEDAWYKLRVTEYHNVQRHILYRRWKDSDTGRVTWKEYSRGAKIISFAGVDAEVVKVANP